MRIIIWSTINVWIGYYGSRFVSSGCRGCSISIVRAIANMHNQNKNKKHARGDHGHFLCLGFHILYYNINLDNIFCYMKYENKPRCTYLYENYNVLFLNQTSMVRFSNSFDKKYRIFLLPFFLLKTFFFPFYNCKIYYLNVSLFLLNTNLK